MTHNHKTHYFVVLILALVAFLFWQGTAKLGDAVTTEEARVKNIAFALGSIQVEAKAISVYNATKNEKIYGRNDTSSMPIASLAKILTIALAVNDKNKDEIVIIDKAALSQVGDFGLLLDEKWRIEDLAKIALVSSANDAAFVIASNYFDFLDKLNLTSQRLGTGSALFSNFTGLDIIEDEKKKIALAGALASAEDVNQMAIFLLRKNPELASVTTKLELTLISESGLTHTFKNTDTIVEKIPNLLFSKTGFTEIAGGNLTIIFRNQRGEEIAVTVLGSTFNGRFIDMEKIVSVLYNS